MAAYDIGGRAAGATVPVGEATAAVVEVVVEVGAAGAVTPTAASGWSGGGAVMGGGEAPRSWRSKAK